LRKDKSDNVTTSSFVIPVIVVVVLCGLFLACFLFRRSRRPKDKSAFEKWVDVFPQGTGVGEHHREVNAPTHGHEQDGVEMSPQHPPPHSQNHPYMADIYEPDEQYTSRLSVERQSLHQNQHQHQQHYPMGAYMTPQGYIVNPLLGRLETGANDNIGDSDWLASQRDSIPYAQDLDARLSSASALAAAAPSLPPLRLSTRLPQPPPGLPPATSTRRLSTAAGAAGDRDELFGKIHDMQDQMTRDIAKIQQRLSSANLPLPSPTEAAVHEQVNGNETK